MSLVEAVLGRKILFPFKRKYFYLPHVLGRLALLEHLPHVHQGATCTDQNLKNIRTNPTLHMRSKFCSVLAVVAEEFFLWNCFL